MIDQKQLGDLINSRHSVQAAARKIMTDPKEHGDFLADPEGYLKKAGLAVKGRIDLTERDKQIIRLVADAQLSALYKAGDMAKLSQYLQTSYPSLVNDPTRVGWTVADFEVAIEAVAVAVGVFVAPLATAEDFSEVARLEAVHAARLDAVESRMSALEAQLRQAGGGS
jgi:hypothetical protein